MKIKIAYKKGSNLFVLLIASAFILFAVNCKPKKDTRPFGPQYEEDPGPERGTTAERLEGKWHIEDYLKDGVSVYNQMNATANSSITLDNVYFIYTMANKNNGWNESREIYPWPWYFDLNNQSFIPWGYDSIFCFWLNNPSSKTKYNKTATWQITKLYKNSFYTKLIIDSVTYKILWKR